MDPRQQRILIWIGSAIAVLLIALITVLLVDDGGSTVAAQDETSVPPTSSEATGPSDTSTTSTPESTSSTADSTTTTAATTTTVAGACAGLPGVAVPGPEPGVSIATGDFDGDGAPDQLIGYEGAAGTWWIQVALSYGYASQTAVPGPVTAVGATDFGAGQDVGYAFVDAGASTQLAGFFFLPGCDVFEVTDDSGAPARFPVGGGVMHLDGLTCVEDGIITKSATTNDGVSWEYSTTRWAWVPGLLEFQPVSSSIALLTSPADDAVIFGAASFDCPDTTL